VMETEGGTNFEDMHDFKLTILLVIEKLSKFVRQNIVIGINSPSLIRNIFLWLCANVVECLTSLENVGGGNRGVRNLSAY